MILLAGQNSVFERAEPYLRRLGGDLRYLGSKVGAAAALDLALLSYSIGAMLGLFHGALICESEGTSVGLIGSLFTDSWAVNRGKRARDRATVIEHGTFDKTEASLGVWNSALQRILQQARDAGMGAEFPDFAAGVFERATRAGFGHEDVSALIKTMRST